MIARARQGRVMHRRSNRLLLTLVALVAACAAVLVDEEREQSHAGRWSMDFQYLVGGLGFGPALDLGGCALGFDPRLDNACGQDYGPVPGGQCFCPRHAGSVFFYPPPRPHGAREERIDAPPP